MTFEGILAEVPFTNVLANLCAWKLLALERRGFEDAKKGQLDFFLNQVVCL